MSSTPAAIVFSGPVWPPATKPLRSACCRAVNDGHDSLILMMNSTGGGIDEGFGLYGFLRALPVDLTLVNLGIVGSIANIVFLAGETRIAVPDAVFLFHGFSWTYDPAQTVPEPEMREHLMILASVATRMTALMQARTGLSAADFATHRFLETPSIHPASFALEKGIVHRVEQVVLERSTRLINVEF